MAAISEAHIHEHFSPRRQTVAQLGSLLHWRVAYGDNYTHLLDSNSLFSQNPEGNTPLHLGIMNGRDVDPLINALPDEALLIQNTAHYTPVCLAILHNHQKTLGIMQKRLNQSPELLKKLKAIIATNRAVSTQLKARACSIPGIASFIALLNLSPRRKSV